MKTSALKKHDYNPYYGTYIEALGEVDLLATLKKQRKNFPKFIGSIPKDKLHYAYADGKWTIAEVLIHIIDTERVFQYRALRFARNDQAPLPGFDQDAYVPQSGGDKRTIKDLSKEYRAVRRSTIELFKTFDDTLLARKGVGSNSPMSVAALGFIMCGHQKHHRNIIRERYLQD